MFGRGLFLFGSIVTLLFLLHPQNSSFVAAANTPTASYQITDDRRNQATIVVNGSGAVVTLADIQQAVAVTDTTYLTEPADDIWQLNVNLVIGKDVTLNLSPAHGVRELRLRSGNRHKAATLSHAAPQATLSHAAPQATLSHAAPQATLPHAASNTTVQGIAYSTFVYLKAESGTINIDEVTIYSWNSDTDAVDENEQNGRAYILAKYASTLNIRNSDIGYLGSKDGESYGIAWRDVGEEDGEFVTRVTGEVLNSKIHHNYYGIYTYQAAQMTFSGNEFYRNIRYGFDPHDYSHHFLVENNRAYENGAHGFIISRGCHNFIFRNNRSHDNFDPGSNLAHGFMLDPGGAKIDKPQVSSSNNLLENNEAYANEGYGIRILGSSNNTLRNNKFHQNEMGISIDAESNANLFQNNQLFANRRYGFFIRENQENRLLTNRIADNGSEGIEIRKAHGLRIEENELTGNASHGIDLSDGAKANLLERNLIARNDGYGVVIRDSKSTGNRWSANRIFANADGGIDDRVETLDPPQLTEVSTTHVAGHAKARVRIELFRNEGSAEQGQFYVGATESDQQGRFAYEVDQAWVGGYITAIAIETAGGTNGSASAFSRPIAVPTAADPTATVTPTTPATPTPSATATATPAISPTPSGTATALPTPTDRPTSEPTVTMLPTPVTTPSATATAVIITPTATVRATATVTAVATAASTPVGAEQPHQLYVPFVTRP